MGIWENGLTPNNVTDLILTGFRGEPKEMTHSTILEKYCLGGDSILDFGCGVGRNSNFLKKIYKTVFSYDLPSMLVYYPDEFKSDNIHITSDWEYIKKQKVDEVLCSLVLQHLRPNDLHSYLLDITKITNKLIVLSRNWQDYTNQKTLPILKKYFYIEFHQKSGKEHFIAVLKVK